MLACKRPPISLTTWIFCRKRVKITYCSELKRLIAWVCPQSFSLSCKFIWGVIRNPFRTQFNIFSLVMEYSSSRHICCNQIVSEFSLLVANSSHCPFSVKMMASRDIWVGVRKVFRIWSKWARADVVSLCKERWEAQPKLNMYSLYVESRLRVSQQKAKT